MNIGLEKNACPACISFSGFTCSSGLCVCDCEQEKGVLSTFKFGIFCGRKKRIGARLNYVLWETKLFCCCDPSGLHFESFVSSILSSNLHEPK